jgi:hypothetical protein
MRWSFGHSLIAVVLIRGTIKYHKTDPLTQLAPLSYHHHSPLSAHTHTHTHTHTQVYREIFLETTWPTIDVVHPNTKEYTKQLSIHVG